MSARRANGGLEHTERTLRAFAAACYDNAQSLSRSADLLEQHGVLHHALVFADIGLEEFGKAIIITVAAVRTDMRDRLPKKVADHRTKRFFASRARTTKLGFAEFIAELARQPVAVMIRTAQEVAPEYYSTGGHGRPAPEWRDAALYIDLLPDGSINDPRKVSLHGAVDVGLLRAILHTYRALPAILCDSQNWTAFAASVRRSLARQ